MPVYHWTIQSSGRNIPPDAGAEREGVRRGGGDALELMKKALGEEHPDTLISMNGLAVALSKQGKYAEAEEMQRRTLELKEKALGKEHSSTSVSVWWLAYLLEGQRSLNGSTSLYERACTGFQKVLGPDHPDTVSCSKQYESILKNVKGRSEE